MIVFAINREKLLYSEEKYGIIWKKLEKVTK